MTWTWPTFTSIHGKAQCSSEAWFNSTENSFVELTKRLCLHQFPLVLAHHLSLVFNLIERAAAALLASLEASWLVEEGDAVSFGSVTHGRSYRGVLVGCQPLLASPNHDATTDFERSLDCTQDVPHPRLHVSDVEFCRYSAN